jgi:hypothetical protein
MGNLNTASKPMTLGGVGNYAIPKADPFSSLTKP